MVKGSISDEQFLLGDSHWLLSVHYDGLYVNTITETSPNSLDMLSFLKPLHVISISKVLSLPGFTGSSNNVVIEVIKVLQLYYVYDTCID